MVYKVVNAVVYFAGRAFRSYAHICGAGIRAAEAGTVIESVCTASATIPSAGDLLTRAVMT